MEQVVGMFRKSFKAKPTGHYLVISKLNTLIREKIPQKFLIQILENIGIMIFLFNRNRRVLETFSRIKTRILCTRYRKGFVNTFKVDLFPRENFRANKFLNVSNVNPRSSSL